MKIDAAAAPSTGVSTSEREGSDSTYRVLSNRGVVAGSLTSFALAIGALLRWYHLGHQSLWFDEGYTLLQSGLSISNLVGFARSETYPPLYPLLQHGWGAVFGNSEASLRGVSAFCGILSLPVFFLVARKLLKDSWAVALAVWVFALSLMQIWYSQEARAYELSSFLALVGLYALVLFLERRSVATFVAIVLATAASLYTHNMMFFYLLALNLAWLILPSERAWTQRVKEVMLADVLAGVLYLPWLPSMLSQVARVHGGFWIPRPAVSTLLRTSSFVAGFNLEYLSWLPSRLLPLSERASWVCVVAGVGLLSVAMVVGGLWRVPEEDRRKNVALMVYGLLPILMVFLLSQITRPLFIDRVFISSSVVIPIVFAYPLAVQKGRKARMVYGVLGIVLGVAIALSGFGYLRYQEKEDWRGVTRSLLNIPERNRLIVFAPTAGKFLFTYYSQRFSGIDSAVKTVGLPKSLLEQFPPRLGALTGPTDISPLKDAVESGNFSEVDLVLSSESPMELSELALRYLNEHLVFQQEQQFHGLRVVRFLARSH